SKGGLAVKMPDGSVKVTIPDKVTETLIIECKNYCKSTVTETAQIRAQLEAAQQANKGYTLVVPPGAKVERTLARQINDYNFSIGNPPQSGILTFDEATGQLGKWSTTP
ncbi:MAG: putative toxin, partial [Rhodobacteraceae bacterium]|nr:putative toxin [Paracoccaceae bacterium]